MSAWLRVLVNVLGFVLRNLPGNGGVAITRE